MEPLSWPPTDLDAVCLPKALPVAVLDDLEKASGKGGNGRMEEGGKSELGWEREEERAPERQKRGRGRIHLIKMENMRRALYLWLAVRCQNGFLTRRNERPNETKVLVCVPMMLESDSPSSIPSSSSRVGSSPVLCLSLMKVGSLDHDGERERAEGESRAR